MSQDDIQRLLRAARRAEPDDEALARVMAEMASTEIAGDESAG